MREIKTFFIKYQCKPQICNNIILILSHERKNISLWRFVTFPRFLDLSRFLALLGEGVTSYKHFVTPISGGQ